MDKETIESEVKKRVKAVGLCGGLLMAQSASALISKMEVAEFTGKYLDIEPIPYVLSPQYIEFPGGKEFVCKGKHQYREVKEKKDNGLVSVSWVCQCGRNMKD